jgi:hypothetical protein
MRTRSIGIVAGVLIVCLNTAFAQSPTPGFSSATTTLAATTDPAGSGPDWAATGDLNGGGKPDMVRVANAASNNMNFDARVATLEKQLVAQEKELQSLKDELALLKKANSTATDAPTDAQREVPSDNSAFTTALSTPQPPSTSSTARSAIDSTIGSTHFFGLMDTYYSYNVHQPVSGLSNLMLFDGQTNQFALNLVELGAVRVPDTENRFGYNFTLGFGDAVNLTNQRDPGGLGFAQYLVEAYASYLAPVGSGLQLDVGKFSAGAGAESMESQANWNYSRGLLYDYGMPFYLFGVRSRYTFGDKYSLTGYLVNGWDNVVDTYDSGKTTGLSFRWTPAKRLSVTETVLGGRGATPQDIGWRKLSSTVVQYSPDEKLSLMANAIYGSSDEFVGFANPVHWSGVAGYVKYRFSPLYSVASRYEYYSDPDGVTTCTSFAEPTPQNIHEVTATLERRFRQHLISRFEIRNDRSSQPVFFQGNTPIPTQMTMTAGLMFAFGGEDSATEHRSYAEK